MNIKQSIKQLADQCVKCGVCAPACPTYVKTQHEGESARGRIALMEALATGKLPLNKTLLSHLDSCLYCRACEAVCPSEVAYGELLNVTYQLIAKQKSFSKYLDWLLRSPQHLTVFAKLLQFYQISGLQWLAKKTQLLRLLKLSRWDSYLPKLKFKRWRTLYHTRHPKQGTVALFTGCIVSFVEANTVQAAIQLLNAWGFDVHLPKNQTCCGAFHLHGGSPHFAQLAEKTVQQFSHLKSQPTTLFLASGCGMILKDYPTTLAHYPHKLSNEMLAIFSKGLSDIPAFLSQQPQPPHLGFKPLPIKVAIHTPCSLKNSLKTEDAVLNLLQRIPNITLLPLVAPTRCCGAAGLSMLTHPDMADELAQDLLTQIIALQPDILITSNIGCRMHLTTQLRTRKIDVMIMHPVELLARQL